MQTPGEQLPYPKPQDNRANILVPWSLFFLQRAVCGSRPALRHLMEWAGDEPFYLEISHA